MLGDSVLALPCFVCAPVGAKSLALDGTLLESCGDWCTTSSHKLVGSSVLASAEIDGFETPRSTMKGDNYENRSDRGVLLILDCCQSAGFAENAPDSFRSLGTGEYRIV